MRDQVGSKAWRVDLATAQRPDEGSHSWQARRLTPSFEFICGWECFNVEICTFGVGAKIADTWHHSPKLIDLFSVERRYVELLGASTMAAAVAFVARSAIPVLERGQTKVIPRWWSGRYVIDPDRFVIDGRGNISKEDLLENSIFNQEIKAKYNDVGVVHVQNTGERMSIASKALVM